MWTWQTGICMTQTSWELEIGISTWAQINLSQISTGLLRNINKTINMKLELEVLSLDETVDF